MTTFQEPTTSGLCDLDANELMQVEGGMAPVICVVVIAACWGVAAGALLFGPGSGGTAYKNSHHLK